MIGRTNCKLNNDKIYNQIINYTMLYDKGDECEEVTGGWIGGRYITAYGDKVGTYTKNETSLYCKAGTSSSLLSCGFFTANKINLFDKSKVWFNITEHYRGWACSIALNATDRLDDTKTNRNGELGVGLYNIDASNITDEMYVGFGCWSYGSIISVNSSFVTKADDWQTLAEKAGISTSSMDDLLTNSSTLLSNKEAVNFMIYNCTGDFMVSAIQSSTFLTALNNSEYKTRIYANKHWAKFLNMVA